MKVDVALLQRADIQGRESLHNDSPKEAQGTQYVLVRVKSLHGRVRVVVDHAELQLAGSLIPAHGSGWPRFARANVSSTLGRGLGGKGVSEGPWRIGCLREAQAGGMQQGAGHVAGAAGHHRARAPGTGDAGSVCKRGYGWSRVRASWASSGVYCVKCVYAGPQRAVWWP